MRKSILNFGLPDIAHRTIDEISARRRWRTRSRPCWRTSSRASCADTIRVTRDISVDAAELKVRFMVRADLFCEPLNVPVEFVADVEIDSGKIVISRL